MLVKVGFWLVMLAMGNTRKDVCEGNSTGAKVIVLLGYQFYIMTYIHPIIQT